MDLSHTNTESLFVSDDEDDEDARLNKIVGHTGNDEKSKTLGNINRF